MPRRTDWKLIARQKMAENANLCKALRQIRDTAIAMDDAIRAHPKTRTIICIEGPRRIKDTANEALLS